MKKLIYILGITFLLIIVILNLLFITTLDAKEHVTINFNSFIYVLGVILTSIIIYFGAKVIDNYLYNEEIKSKEKLRKILFIVSIMIYILFNIVWVIKVRPMVVGDQIHACNLAQTFYSGDLERFLPNATYAGIPLIEYMQAYHQQISLAFVFSVFFRIIHFDGIEILRVLSIIGNVFIVFSLYKINLHLSKKYKTNKSLLFILILTFISLPMLSTFIYGDIPSLALCLFSVYFMMKYVDSKKIVYPIFAGIFIMVAYMMRMNSLIFIIATVIYLLLDLFKDITKKAWKENLIKIVVIVGYIIISILPSSLVKNYYLNKYNLDKNKEYPNISYFLMAMEEGPRGNGWYNESIGEPALKNPENKEKEYLDRIKNRLKYFAKNLGYTFDFYITKIASMWTENTYSAIRNNTLNADEPLEKMINPLEFYQKALLLVTCLCSLIVILHNRKNLSIDIIFLLTIFVGGFAFHILWEAKSRYIIPYIIVLIPIASLYVNTMKNLPKESVEKNIS